MTRAIAADAQTRQLWDELAQARRRIALLERHDPTSVAMRADAITGRQAAQTVIDHENLDG